MDGLRHVLLFCELSCGVDSGQRSHPFTLRSIGERSTAYFVLHSNSVL